MPRPNPLYDALKSIHPETLSSDDALTIIELANAAFDAGPPRPEAIRLFVAIESMITMLTDEDYFERRALPSNETAPEQIRSVAAKLSTKAARELAYAAAHLFLIIDNQIAPALDEFHEVLRTALELTKARADELAAQVRPAITPTRN